MSCSGSDRILVLFVCKSCRSSFPLIDEFIQHKTTEHSDEFKRINCIIFEEQISYGNTVQKKELGIPKSVSNGPKPQDTDHAVQVDDHSDDRTDTKDPLALGGRIIEPDPLTYSIEFIKSESQNYNLRNAVVSRIFDESTATVQVSASGSASTGTGYGYDLDSESVENFETEAEAGSFGGCETPETETAKLTNPTVNLRRLTSTEIREASAFQSQDDFEIKCEPEGNVPPCSSSPGQPNQDRFQKNHTDTNFQDIEPEPGHTCKLCLRKYKNEIEISDHVNNCLLQHKDRERFCFSCNKLFCSTLSIKGHMLIYHATEEEREKAFKFKCKLCPRKFLRKRELVVHMESHKRKDQRSKPFKCSVCGHAFLTKNYLTKHFSRVHPDDNSSSTPASVLVTDPDHDPNSDPDVDPHEGSENGNDIDPLAQQQIDPCEKNNLNPTSITSPENILPCINPVVNFAMHLNQHQDELGGRTRTTATDADLESLDLTCKLCLQKYNTETQLKTHTMLCLLNHKDRKRFCVPCNKLLCNAMILKGHMLTFHATEEEKKKAFNLKCKLCPRKFLRKRELLVHLESHKSQEQRCKPYKCQYCDRSFLTKDYLTKHSRIHSEDKPFQCTYPGCENKYKIKASLQDHIGRHNDPRRFHCPHEACSKNYTQEKDLKLHLQSSH